MKVVTNVDDVLVQLALLTEPSDTKSTASERKAMRKWPAAAPSTPKPKVAKQPKVAKEAKVAKQAKAAKAEPGLPKEAAKAKARLVKEAAAEATHANGVKMTWKCIHSRAYHGAIRKAKLQGLSDEEAKVIAAEAIAEAKKTMTLQNVLD